MAQVASELISVTNNEKLTDAKYIKDLDLGDKKQSDINKDSLSGGVYNVTKLHSLQSGNYYTLSTAIAVLTSAAPDLRCFGMVITYQVDSESWETKQFKGDTLNDWADTDKWEDFGGRGNGDGAYNISVNHPTSGVNGGNAFTLLTALTVLNSSAPASVKKGGMTIKYVDSNTNKYVQYILRATDFNVTESNWKKIITEDDFEDWEQIDYSDADGELDLCVYEDKWRSLSGSYVFRVVAGATYILEPDFHDGENSDYSISFAVLKSYPPSSISAGSIVTTFATGYNRNVGRADDPNPIRVIMPSDANYITVRKAINYGTVNIIPKIYLVNNKYIERSNVENVPTFNNTNPISSGAVYNLEKDLSDEIVGYSLYPYPVLSTGKYGTISTYQHAAIPVSEGEKYIIKKVAADTSTNHIRYAFATANTYSSDGNIPLVTNTSVQEVEGLDNEVIVPIPSGCNFLVFNTGSEYPMRIWKYKSKIEGKDIAVTTKRIYCQYGMISNITGTYPKVQNTYDNIKGVHTPKFIKTKGTFKLHLLKITRTVYVYYYDEDQGYLHYDEYTDLLGDDYLELSVPIDIAYWRISFWENDNPLSYADYIDIDGQWNLVDDDVFQKRPTDNGYQLMTFKVESIKCSNPVPAAGETSALNSQIVVTTDSGMLHLPESYREYGEGTPLIIYVHGAANDYKLTNNAIEAPTEFAEACPLAPEWAAAGYAQMDVDLIPDAYNDNVTNNGGGSADDPECIIGAYKWAIEHFNIRRDGVYLMGRSRGGQAVLQMLGRYNPSVMPIIAAVSNAGAHTLISYGAYSNNTKFSNNTYQWDLICKSFGIYDTAGRPTSTNTAPIVAQNGLYSFLAPKIKNWWKKACVAYNLIVGHKPQYSISDGSIVESYTEWETPEALFEFMHNNPQGSNTYSEYLNLLKTLRFRSPVPLRFDWCVDDTVQPWKANGGEGNYSKIIKDGFVNNPNGNAEYREWPSVSSSGTLPSGVTEGTRGHWHELFNLYDGDYVLPNGKSVTNPSMARVEWLEWCRRYDNRF